MRFYTFQFFRAQHTAFHHREPSLSWLSRYSGVGCKCYSRNSRYDRYQQETEVKTAYPGCLLASWASHVTQAAVSGLERLSDWVVAAMVTQPGTRAKQSSWECRAKTELRSFPSRVAQTIMKAPLKGAQIGGTFMKKETWCLNSFDRSLRR